MSQPNPKPKKREAIDSDEEIDLGHLFYVLGRAISSVFTWFFNLLKGIWDLFISLLLLIRANFKALAAAALLGGLIGGIYQYGIKNKEFESSMTLQPNFGSSVQLYKNIDFYQSLIEQEDFGRLTESLKITEDEARSLKKIEVDPYENDNQVLLAYKDFVQNLDSLTFDLVGYEEFASSTRRVFQISRCNGKSKRSLCFRKTRGPDHQLHHKQQILRQGKIQRLRESSQQKKGVRKLLAGVGFPEEHIQKGDDRRKSKGEFGNEHLSG